MRTELNKGRRLVSGTDFFDFTAKLRATMTPIQQRLDAELIVGEAVLVHDGLDAAGIANQGEFSLIQDAVLSVGDEDDIRPGFAHPATHSFSADFAQDPHTQRILMLPRFQREVYDEALSEMDAVEDYGYWTNADPDEAVSAAEWDARAAAWNRALPEHTSTKEAAVTFTLKHYDPNALREFLPGFNDAPDGRHPAILDAIAAVQNTQLQRARVLIRMRAHDVASRMRGVPSYDIANHIDTVVERLAPQVAEHLPEISADTLYGDNLKLSFTYNLSDLILNQA